MNYRKEHDLLEKKTFLTMPTGVSIRKEGEKISISQDTE